jgi:hypothetical protein
MRKKYKDDEWQAPHDIKMVHFAALRSALSSARAHGSSGFAGCGAELFIFGRGE